MIIPFHCSPVCTHRNRKLLNFTLFQAQRKYHTVILSFSFSEREGTLAKSACSKPCLPVVCFRSVTFQGLSQAASVQTLTELPTAIFSHFICHPQLQMQRSRHTSDKTHHKHSEKAIALIWPTKERETAHIQWIFRQSRHCSSQLHSCPSHMKGTGPATKRLFQLFRLYSSVQVSPNHSPAQHCSCLPQILSSCNPTCLHGFQMPFPPTGKPIGKLKVLPSPPSPPTTQTYTDTSTYMGNGMSPKCFSQLW